MEVVALLEAEVAQLKAAKVRHTVSSRPPTPGTR